MMLAPKLILLAAALSAVAFAAPRSTDDYFEEETLLVQDQAYQLSVNNLKKQFSELQTSLGSKSYAQVTPRVKSVIDDMVKMIETEIEVAIKDAHVADQILVDTEMAKIQTYRNTIFAQQKILYAKAADIRKWIKEHNQLVVDWRGLAEKRIAAANDWTTTHNNMKTTCCAKDNSAVLDVAYLSPYHECDFKTGHGKDKADGCIDRALANTKSYVDPYFKNGRNTYLQLVKKCDNLGNLTVTKHNAYNQADEACDHKEEATRSKADLITTETQSFAASWKSTRDGYRVNVTMMENEYNKKEAQAKHDEKDRKNEWTSTQIIKCMLVNYKAGGGFNDESLASCKTKSRNTGHLNVKYPTMVARITWELAPFQAVSEYDHATTCHADVVQAEPVCQVRAQKPIPECENHSA